MQSYRSTTEPTSQQRDQPLVRILTDGEAPSLDEGRRPGCGRQHVLHVGGAGERMRAPCAAIQPARAGFVYGLVSGQHARTPEPRNFAARFHRTPSSSQTGGRAPTKVDVASGGECTLRLRPKSWTPGLVLGRVPLLPHASRRPAGSGNQRPCEPPGRVGPIQPYSRRPQQSPSPAQSVPRAGRPTPQS
jgi:hypothetical protein